MYLIACTWPDSSNPLLIMNKSYDFIAYLTHWGRDKMAAVSQIMFSNAFSWMKMFEFRLKFHWSLFLRVQLTIFIVPSRRQAIIWTNDGKLTDAYMRHSASMRYMCYNMWQMLQVVGPKEPLIYCVLYWQGYLPPYINIACQMTSSLPTSRIICPR